jgi:predicted esterase
VVHAYRSQLDGSLQPYAVTFPAAYGKDARRRWRLDVVLHGRDASLTELSFLHRHQGNKPAPANDFVQLDIFGRGNNAYRWAGEVDVMEAVQHFLSVEEGLKRVVLLDPARVVLRGFSMGGAGTWHIGLHKPDRWCVLGPGAGFTVTHGFVANLPEKLAPQQEACLTIYDAADYAENVFDVPVVAYAGDKDKQIQALRNIQERLKGQNAPLTVLIAPGLEHQFPPEWQKKAEEEYARIIARGRPEYPRHVHFVTYTLKYPSCDWVDLLSLDRHYDRALVDADAGDPGDPTFPNFVVKTANVASFALRLPTSSLRDTPVAVTINGQKLEARPYLAGGAQLHLYFEKRDGAWVTALPERLHLERLRTPLKAAGLQGPIDDAFTAPFLCVRGTRTPWNEAAQTYADEDLKRFQHEWSTYFHGDLPVKDDVQVTREDFASRNLVLFGDPASNALIEQVLPGLPLQWTKDKLTVDGKDYAAADHLPALIYPSPLSANHYVVLNSGHTFHAADFEGTNALLYPRLGDFAVLKLTPSKDDPLAVEVIRSGLFDEKWRFEPRR